jgi:uncharacterized protein
VGATQIASNPNDLDEAWKARVLFDALTDDKLELTLFPTEHCNFRCTYCYEDFSIGRMDPSVVSGVKELIHHRSAGLRDLQISWFGGEPLVAYDIVLDINRYAQSISREHDFDLQIGMTTNGYALSEPRMVELYESGLSSYQISFDGYGDGHDLTRRRVDGRGTFDTIWSNVLTFERLRQTGVIQDGSIMLRLHVHPDNKQSALDMAKAIRDHLTPEWFSFLIKNVGHYGGKNDDTFKVYKYGASELNDIQQEMGEILAPFVKARLPGAVPVCYAAKANAFTIRADGKVGKCTVALTDSKNDVGRLNPDGTITFDAERAGLWLYALQSMVRKDLACPIGSLPAMPQKI